MTDWFLENAGTIVTAVLTFLGAVIAARIAARQKQAANEVREEEVLARQAEWQVKLIIDEKNLRIEEQELTIEEQEEEIESLTRALNRCAEDYHEQTGDYKHFPGISGA